MLNEPPNLWSRPNANFILKTLNEIRNRIDKEIIRNSVNIICVGDEFNKERTKERYGKEPKIVYYGVNHDFFSKGNAERAKKKFNLRNKFVVMQSGMITEQKNQLESVRTIKNAKDKIPNALLILAGDVADKNYKRKIEEFVKENKLGENVLFTGNLDRNDLRDLYSASSAGLFPIGKQGGWLAPFELLCAGVPIIVSEEMGAASIVKKFNLGTVTRDYSKALLEVYNKKREYRKQAKIASKFVKKNFGWNIFTDKMIKAFEDAIEGN